jgi:hypothetical protein
MTARVHDERVQRSKSDSGSKLGLTAPSLAGGQGATAVEKRRALGPSAFAPVRKVDGPIAVFA